MSPYFERWSPGNPFFGKVRILGAVTTSDNAQMLRVDTIVLLLLIA